MTVSFGDLTLDTETRQLMRDAAEVPLSPKAFELLRILVECRPRALSKTELQERLWPDTYVSEGNIAGLVAEIRRAIGDDARTPRFLRTVQRFGYAFAGEARTGPRTSPRPFECWLIEGSRHLRLQDGENVLGRDDETGGFDSITVSRRHARIVVTSGTATLEDLGSKNGTFLHGQRVTAPRSLQDGDLIGLGSVVLTFRATAPKPSTRTWRG
ncbi:MAG: FHA domain-containing protein [Vicinamibacterales bacterium]